MTFIKRAVSGIALLALLLLAARYLPAPISTAAWIILGLLALALFLPLLLALVNIIFSSDDDGWFDNILESWFLWTALEWPFTLLGWLFRIGRPDRSLNHSNAARPTDDNPVAGITPREPAAAPKPPATPSAPPAGDNLGDDPPGGDDHAIPSEPDRPRPSRPARRRPRRRQPRRPA